MNNFGKGPSNDDRADRGVSPQVGIVLLFGMVIIGAGLIFAVGSIALGSVETQAMAEQGEQMMLQVDNGIETATGDNISSGSIYLEDDGEYELTNDSQITITAVNNYASDSATIPLGSLRYEDENGNTFAHQAGGVWRGDGPDARLVSRPNLRYYKAANGTEGRVELDITNLGGELDNGENRVTSRPVSGEGDLSRDIGFVNYINVTVSGSAYHYGWATFLEDEFDATHRSDCDVAGSPSETIICHDEGAETVTVIAPIEGENPFASHVGIDPTIYGGLYADDDLTIDESVTIDRYNGTVGWVDGNVTEDLLVANGDLGLGSDANVTGVPVVNGHFSGDNDAEISNIAFATDPNGTKIDEINGTEVYNVTGSTPPELFGAKLSESFDGIDDIDQQTERAIRLIDEYEDSDPITSGTLESESDKNVDGFYYANSDVDSIDEFNTSNGNIHVAVDGDVELDGVDVTGSGRAYLYVSGDIDADGVTIDGDRAQNFWIYGTSDADVTVRNEFQGVMYTPESDSLTVAKDTEVYGSIVAGKGVDIRENVSIHFDETLRTDVPIPEENRDVTIEIGERRSPLDVTFVLDRSGSMSSNDPSEQRVDATKNFIGLMQGEDSSVLEGNQSDQAGVYEFNQNGHERHHLSSDLSSVNSSVETSASGGTGIYSGIEIALDEYDRNRSSSAEQHMILLSDGQNDPATEWVCTDGGWLGCDNWEFYDYNQQTLDQAERAADMNVTIHTIGLSEDADSDMLGDIANETDGDYYPADDDDELEEIFEGIADEVTASSPTTFEVESVDEPTAAPHDYAVNVREHPVNIGDE